MMFLLNRLRGPAGIFLICGTLAAGINWFSRIVLSQWLSFQTAVVVAYVIGMVSGFMLYKTLVWPNSHNSLKRQIISFIAVNLLSALIVIPASSALLHIFAFIIPSLGLAEALAHGTAIAIGAISNYFGHSIFTFSKKPNAPPH